MGMWFDNGMSCRACVRGMLEEMIVFSTCLSTPCCMFEPIPWIYPYCLCKHCVCLVILLVYTPYMQSNSLSLCLARRRGEKGRRQRPALRDEMLSSTGCHTKALGAERGTPWLTLPEEIGPKEKRGPPPLSGPLLQLFCWLLERVEMPLRFFEASSIALLRGIRLAPPLFLPLAIHGAYGRVKCH
ncbi:hypothetical protein V8C35DRAFT_205458 [Trichoderma chlorosporum]